MRAKTKKFKHNNEIYTAQVKQFVGDSNYNMRVKIYKGKSVIIGYNAKNNTPIDDIIKDAQKTLSEPSNFVLWPPRPRLLPQNHTNPLTFTM